MPTQQDDLKMPENEPPAESRLPHDRTSPLQPRPFVHLHVQSYFSRPGGATRIEELVEKAKSLGMNAVALTDRGNLFGTMEFYRAATRVGIKPIFGLELHVSSHLRHHGGSDVAPQTGYPLTLLAKDEAGFKNLIWLSSAQCSRADQRNGLVPLGKDVLKAHSEGIICLSGGFESELFQAARRNQLDKVNPLIRWHQKVFGDRFYLEIQRTGSTPDGSIDEVLHDAAQRLGVPSVVTSDVRYVEATDFETPVLLNCLSMGRTMPSMLLSQKQTFDSHLFSPDEMYARFPNRQESLGLTQVIADMIDVDLEAWQRRHDSASHVAKPYTDPQGAVRPNDGQEPHTIEPTLSTFYVRGSSRARDRLIAFLQEEHGAKRVAKGRILFRNDSPRVQIRAVCCVLGLRCEQADEIVDMIPEDFSGTITAAANEIAALRDAVQRSARVRRIVELAGLLQGTYQVPAPCSLQVVVGHRALSEDIPLARDQGQVFTQWNIEELIPQRPSQLFADRETTATGMKYIQGPSDEGEPL